MKLLHAQSNLEDVLEQENFNALSYEYYDDTEILPQLGIYQCGLHAPGSGGDAGVCPGL